MTRKLLLKFSVAAAAFVAGSGCDRPGAGERAPRESALLQRDSRKPVQTASSSFTPAPDSGAVRRYRAVNQRFLFSGSLAGDSGILVRETLTEDCCKQAERKSSITISLAGWSTASSEGAPSWVVELSADEGRIWNNGSDAFYVATLHACCDGDPLDTYVSLHTGKPTYFNSRFSTREGLPAVFDRHRRQHRLVAFHDGYTLSDPPEMRNDEGFFVGILQYGPADGPVARILVRQTAYDRSARYPGLGSLALDEGRGKEEFDIEA